MPATSDALTAFAWTPQPEAAALVEELLAAFLAGCAPAAALAVRLREETGTRLVDWLDHLVVARTPGLDERLARAGFVPRPGDLPGTAWRHPQGLFPLLVVCSTEVPRIAIKVESVADACAAHGVDSLAIVGHPGWPLRHVRLAAVAGGEVWAIERWGVEGLAHGPWDDRSSIRFARHAERLRSRRRAFADDLAGFDHADRLVDAAAADLGRDTACALFFAAERDYWQRRNRAARVQKARQDALGLGWANSDHHTYRSSRHCFARLIASLERMGFACRERFYAGQEAGWGAQVLEHEITGVVIFADVDLAPDELAGDFAHQPLPPRDQLGTVGLWCALHGEAFLQAGMHHLECTFDFATVRSQLATAGVAGMKPFTDYPYLRQAFTEGERWPVDPARVARLVAAGLLDAADGARFVAQGAIGSHLEVLERNDGFKGFNQRGVSEIIAGTDPRRHGGG